MAEFIGAGVLTLVILNVQRSTIGVPYFVATVAGLAAAVLVVAFGRTSGAQLNPAITIALWTARKVGTLKALSYVGAQLLGAWAAYYLYTYLVRNSFQPIGGHFSSRVLVAEAVGGMVLGLGWATAVYQQYVNSSRAALVGAAYMLAIIAASAASIGLVNPAVALGARAWVWGTYVLGPVLGAVIGVNLYGLLFAPANSFARLSRTASATTVTSARTESGTKLRATAPVPTLTTASAKTPKAKAVAKKKANVAKKKK